MKSFNDRSGLTAWLHKTRSCTPWFTTFPWTLDVKERRHQAALVQAVEVATASPSVDIDYKRIEEASLMLALHLDGEKEEFVSNIRSGICAVNRCIDVFQRSRKLIVTEKTRLDLIVAFIQGWLDSGKPLLHPCFYPPA